jgi:hypothetical protein
MTYSNSLNRCIAYAQTTCPTGYTYNSSTGRCEASPICPGGYTYNPTTNRCELRVQVKKKITVAVGKVGDNYWCGNCIEKTVSTTITIDNVENLDSFVLKRVKFDDWIEVSVNGHVVYRGPYGGDRLVRVCYNWITGETCYPGDGWCICQIQYDDYRYGWCELSTSWEFQSLIGKLKTRTAKNLAASSAVFQSLIGKLKTRTCLIRIFKDLLCSCIVAKIVKREKLSETSIKDILKVE